MARNPWAHVCLAVLLGSLILIACGQDFRGPPPFGRGFGGPGGPGNPVALLGMNEVQQELNLNDDQKAKLGLFQRESQSKFQELFESFNPFAVGDLEESEREKRFAEMREKSDALTREATEKIDRILDVPQKKRFAELRLQREGAIALGRDDVAKSLGLKKEQADKIRELLAQVPPPFAPAEERERFEKDLLALLSDDQRSTFAAMKGQELRFPEASFGPGGGRGFGPPGQQTRKLVARFDDDHDGRLNRDERTAAREAIKKEGGGRGGPGGFGPPGGGFGRPGGGRRGGGGPGFGRNEPASPGVKIASSDVQPVEGDLYDGSILRTLFLDFEHDDWESELADFNNTDVEVPATLLADGRAYENVGVHFRGMSSFFTVPAGSKRSLNLSLDFVDKDQRLGGYRTLNLLNSHEDPTFLHTVLYFHIARQYIPAPKANLVKLVINGESWGVYTNVQQFNNDFVAEHFPNTKGTRWKVQGSPGGRGGLEYLGDDPEKYKAIYSIKSKDKKKAWRALARLCKTLNETPADELEAALDPLLDVDGALWFLALENVLINGDGYWVRASDYTIYLDDAGKFHLIPHDANETLAPPMGPGFGGPRGGGFGGRGRGGPGGRDRGPGGPGRPGGPDGPGGAGQPGDRGGPGSGRGNSLELDPLVGLNDNAKPLRSKLLAVPALRARYLDHVRTLATEWLDWEKLGPLVQQYAALIEPDIQADTKKLTSYEEFQRTTAQNPPDSSADGRVLRVFAKQRREYLLSRLQELSKP